ncbi:DUF5641 domain-containing protein [Nephila pilipes]|uniref:DUF5641 domain-containing protein n=1 Tax=Nephila pilipes TaxID=299642 RepID=A0A8X6PT21_NEPPI|nr:DUF5641 domain-containing protein [Nephila pilipes]
MLNWPLGRVIEMFQEKDNIERVAKLRVSNGEIIRPIQRIYPLELSSSEIFEDVPANSYFPKEQEETLNKTRLGRQIVPPKRLDL